MELPSPLPTATELLRRIFTHSPSPLPPHLVSTPLRFTHQFLPSDAANPAYYQLLPSPEVSKRLKDVVESGVPLAFGETGYHLDQDDVTCFVELDGAGLAFVLRWEEEQFLHSTSENEGDRVGAGWKLNTIALPSTLIHFHRTLDDAVNALTDVNGTRSGKPDNIEIPAASSNGKSRQDMAEGQGSTPGAYGTAGDFWDGWSDDEADQPARQEPESGARDGESYWDRYDDHATSTIDDHPGDQSLDSGQHLSISQPSSVRSRRSSTIKAPAPSLLPEAITTTSKETPVFLPLPPSSYRSPTHGSPHPKLMDVPSPLLIPLPPAVAKATNGHSSTLASSLDAVPNGLVTNGSSRDSFADGGEDEFLRFALAGLWGLYSSGARGAERDEKARKWQSVAAMVVKS